MTSQCWEAPKRQCIPRWWLAWEGPFLAEQSSSVIRSFGAECAFRQTTYRASDYALPLGVFGVPLIHPRYLEWIGVPELASLLEMGPGRWLNTLSREKAMAAAIQLHHEVCLMTTNVDILDNMPSRCRVWPRRCWRAASVTVTIRRQMEAMGLWRPSLDPIHLKPDV